MIIIGGRYRSAENNLQHSIHEHGILRFLMEQLLVSRPAWVGWLIKAEQRLVSSHHCALICCWAVAHLDSTGKVKNNSRPLSLVEKSSRGKQGVTVRQQQRVKVK
jgi:hypothetical protein